MLFYCNPQWGNFRIFLSLIFYVKSKLVIFEVQYDHFNTFRGSEIWLLWIFAVFECWNFSKSKSQRFKNCKNSIFWTTAVSKLISHEIWVTEKSWNFYTVKSTHLCLKLPYTMINGPISQISEFQAWTNFFEWVKWDLTYFVIR